jgi:hypothetical protein
MKRPAFVLLVVKQAYESALHRRKLVGPLQRHLGVVLKVVTQHFSQFSAQCSKLLFYTVFLNAYRLQPTNPMPDSRPGCACGRPVSKRK